MWCATAGRPLSPISTPAPNKKDVDCNCAQLKDQKGWHSDHLMPTIQASLSQNHFAEKQNNLERREL